MSSSTATTVAPAVPTATVAPATTFTIPDEVFGIVKADDSKVSIFASAFGQEVEVFRSAMAAREEADKAAAEAMARNERIKAKSVEMDVFKKEVERFTLPATIIRLLEKGQAISKKLSDSDGDVSISLGLSLVDGEATVTHRVSGLGTGSTSGSRTSYDYFYNGTKVDGHLTTLLKKDARFNGSIARATLLDSESRPGRKSAWDCIQGDGVLKGRFTRTERTSS